MSLSNDLVNFVQLSDNPLARWSATAIIAVAVAAEATVESLAGGGMGSGSKPGDNVVELRRAQHGRRVVRHRIGVPWATDPAVANHPGGISGYRIAHLWSAHGSLSFDAMAGRTDTRVVVTSRQRRQVDLETLQILLYSLDQRIRDDDRGH